VEEGATRAIDAAIRLGVKGLRTNFISVVVVLALLSSAGVRAFPCFRSSTTAREPFGGSEEAARSEPKSARTAFPGPLEL
jgi:hypothetical protein